MTGAALPRRLTRLPRRAAGDVVVLVASTFRSRLCGLLGVRTLPPLHGLLIVPSAAVHTLGMRFELDLVWLDREGSVVRVDHTVRPGRTLRCKGARAVIETRSGDGDAVALAVTGAGVAIVDGH